MLNTRLQKIYEERWDALLCNAKDNDATYPLLLKVSLEYEQADVRVMVVGQETDGWGGILEEKKNNILNLQNSYFKYLYTSKEKNRRPFWNRKNFKYYKEEITKRLADKKVSFLWNNVSKIGKNGSGKPTEKIAKLEEKYFDVFEAELQILEPNIIIFTSGDRRIPLAHEKLETVSKMPVAEVRLKNYPHILALRTYHPNAKIKGGKKRYKQEIVEIISQKYTNS